MPTRSTTTLATTALAVLLVLPVGAAAAPGSTGGLPQVESGPRPGPSVLYAPPPRAPQLENVAGWRAEPILVSGAEAYRDGEWLYQDFLFDDHGATGVVDPGDPYGPSSHLYSPTAGTFTYPEDEVYANNAADLVELRVRPDDGATRLRVTLNTLIDPDRTAFTVAIGNAVDAATWPHGAGVRSPASLFLTVHGEQAELRDAATGELVTPTPTASVDLERRQIDVAVPHAAWDPERSTVRLTIGVGLWDPDAGTYLAPQPGSRSSTTPGGGTPAGVALVNVGPRFEEPMPVVAGATMGDTAVGARVLASWWRERQQSLQLTAGDVTPFAAELDFGRLLDGEDDDSGVPTTGPMNRIMASRYVFGQGLDPSRVCFGISSGVDLGAECVGRHVGQLQPYAIFVPDGPPPADGFGLTLLLHSLSANHNQYLSTANQVQLGQRGAGSVVVTPAGRGPDGFYKGVPEADVFEVWADAARHVPIDPTWVTASGYSMGGFGTYRLLARWPDLFARGFSVVGVPGSADDQLASLRHTPLLAWNAAGDELVHVTEAEQAHADLVAAGIDHTYALFPTADHLTLAGNDEYGLGAEYLGEHRVVRDPATVSYVVDPSEDSEDVVADHAYWLSDLTVRDDADGTGTIEVHSEGFGTDRGRVEPRSEGGGALTGGTLGALPFVERGLQRTEPGSAPIADRLEVTASNVGRVTVDPVRARVSCDAEVVVDSDGPLEVVLDGCVETPGADPAPDGAPPAAAPTPPPAAAPLPATGGGTLAVLGAGLIGLAARARRR